MKKPNLPLPAPGPKLCAAGRRLLQALRPPVWALLVLTAGCAAGLIWVFLHGFAEQLWAVPLYVVSFYALAAFCLRAGGWAKAIRSAAAQNKLFCALRRSEALRTGLELGKGLFDSLGDTVTKLGGGLWFGSGWLLAAGYYNLVLSAAQLLLLNDLRRREADRTRQLKHYRLCGQLLCAATVPLAVMLTEIVNEGEGAAYSEIYLYWTALLAFFSLGKALVHLVGNRRLENPILAAADCLDYANALVGILSLQVMLLAHFGQGFAYTGLMNLLTGIGVFLLTVSIAVYMLRRSRRELRQQHDRFVAF